jgi:putative membrane protein
MLALLLIRAIFSALGLWIASIVVPGVAFTDTASLVAAVVLLGIANAILRPILFVLTLPLTFITLGLWLLLMNALIIGLVAMLLGGFVVSGFVPCILAAIVTGVMSWIAHMVAREPTDERGE